MKKQNESQIKIQKLLDKAQNRFKLSVALAKRARQLQEGFKPLVDVDPETDLLPIHTAIREMKNDKIEMVEVEQIVDEDESLEKLDLALEVEIEKEEQEKKQKQIDKKAIRDRGKRSKSLLA